MKEFESFDGTIENQFRGDKLFFSDAETYSSDFKLFEELGMKRFKTAYKDPLYVGTVVTEDYKVKLTVECWPAQFWTFEIYNKDADLMTYKGNTGSGALSDFWPTIKLLAEGMIDIKIVNNIEI